MRPLYALLYFAVNYSLRLFYRERLVLNRPEKRHSGTIYVSNHPNSFMDPLVIGSLNYAVVRFMTRSDVFKWWLKPVLWGANMLPIFRQHDGADTRSANSDSFNKVNECLSSGGNILIFGEGFTDDVPVRSLKPVKKGAVRMGFQALESTGWEKKILISPLGVSYSERHKIGSDVVICNEAPICLNDFKEQYLLQPSKTINEVTRLMEKAMQSCIIYVADRSWTGFHENVMRLTGKGFNHETRDVSIPLKERWKYGKDLAEWLNAANINENEELLALKKETESYFALLKRMQVPAALVPNAGKPALPNRSPELAFLLLTWPFMLIGLFHGYIPYIISKRFTEKSFGRKVFWGSVKMMSGLFIGSFYNIALIVAASYVFGFSGWYGLAYYFVIPVFCAVAYKWLENLKSFAIKGKIARQDLSGLSAKKAKLQARVRAIIPVA